MVDEGALKADVFSVLRPEMYVISTAGVSVNHAALIDLTRGLRALIASDSDYHYNEAVYLRLGTLIARLMESERKLTTIFIAAWDRGFKVINGAALRKLPIISISCER